MLKYIISLLLIAAPVMADELKPGESIVMPSGEIITMGKDGIFHVRKKVEIDVKTKPKDELPPMGMVKDVKVTVDQPTRSEKTIRPDGVVEERKEIKRPDGIIEVQNIKTTIDPNATVVLPTGQEIKVNQTEIKPASTETENLKSLPTQPAASQPAKEEKKAGIDEKAFICICVLGLVALFALHNMRKKKKAKKQESKVQVTITPRVTVEGAETFGRLKEREVSLQDPNAFRGLNPMPPFRSLKAPPVWDVVPPKEDS